MTPEDKKTQIADGIASEVDIASAQTSPTITLSDELTLAYVLDRSGCAGRLNAGRVDRLGTGQVRVFDTAGELFEYVSEGQLRSWCVFGPDGQPFDGWSKIHPEDARRFGSNFLNRED